MTREEKEQTSKYLLQMANSLEKGCYRRAILLRAAHIIDESLEQEEPFMDKPCVAKPVCHENKIKVLDKIKEEMEQYRDSLPCDDNLSLSKSYAINYILGQIIDKYIKESEVEE